MATLFPLRGFPTSGKQCALIPSGDYAPSLRSPWRAASDTDHGSGFSFTDITADRAGTRFGELATHSVEDARHVQQRLAAGVAETDIMPPAKDLPENLRGDAFKNRFGSIGSGRYQALIDEINARIDACSMYRE